MQQAAPRTGCTVKIIIGRSAFTFCFSWCSLPPCRAAESFCRCVVQGKSFVDEEDSPLEGASPAEIEDLAKSVRVAAPAPQLAFSAQWAKGPLEEDPYEVSEGFCDPIGCVSQWCSNWISRTPRCPLCLFCLCFLTELFSEQ